MNISVVGLGKLGLCFAACCAHRGLDTLGVDIDETLVKSVNAGRSPIVEPRLRELVAEVGGKSLRANLDHKKAIQETDVTFVMVATPSNKDGMFSNRYVESALISLATALAVSPKPYHLFVISSTVVPGSTDGFIRLIENHSGRKVNEGFGVCYDPDFVALGDVIDGFLRPDFLILGESDVRAGDILAAIHHRIHEFSPVISRMSIISAEIAKVALNTYITVKITFANQLANLCEQIPGADLDVITRAIGVDKRISPYYFRGGLSYGGTCFPRDTTAFIQLCKQHRVSAELLHAVESLNRYQDRHLTDLVLQSLAEANAKRVSILGLSFKPKSPVITESPAIKLIGELLKHDIEIIVHDPEALENTRVLFNDALEYSSSPAECIARAAVCVITHPVGDYKSAAENYHGAEPVTFIDCWRILDPNLLAGNVRRVAWGYADTYRVETVTV